MIHGLKHRIYSLPLYQPTAIKSQEKTSDPCVEKFTILPLRRGLFIFPTLSTVRLNRELEVEGLMSIWQSLSISEEGYDLVVQYLGEQLPPARQHYREDIPVERVLPRLLVHIPKKQPERDNEMSETLIKWLNDFKDTQY